MAALHHRLCVWQCGSATGQVGISYIIYDISPVGGKTNSKNPEMIFLFRYRN